MKNIFKYLWVSAALLPFLTGCNSLDLEFGKYDNRCQLLEE